ncbi:hypothetical protein BAMA_13470 [Bacillus manliponensis]|uniref:Uncharacterized protein n=1 Tax=Bacillus manliponensis TaxID=574376 RepID=A0A073K1Z1_9BACI|nr:hypothetical protein BAMA_13470 [Bacillus manliponensis]
MKPHRESVVAGNRWFTLTNIALECQAEAIAPRFGRWHRYELNSFRVTEARSFSCEEGWYREIFRPFST